MKQLMQKKIAGIFVLVSVFCVVGATAQKSSTDFDLSMEMKAAEILVKTGIKFEFDVVTCGDRFTYLTGKFSDGTFLSRVSIHFETAAKAQEYLKNQLKDAVKFIRQKQEPLITSTGKTVYREEGLVMLKGKAANDFKFYRYSLTERYLDETFSDSLKHLLANEILEKQEKK